MKLFILGVVSLVVSSSAYAAGISGVITLTNPENPVVIIDQRGRPIPLRPGNWNVRLSNASSNMTLFSEDTGQKIVISVPTGFPNHDLRYFDLPGAAANQNIDFSGRSTETNCSRVFTMNFLAQDGTFATVLATFVGSVPTGFGCSTGSGGHDWHDRPDHDHWDHDHGHPNPPAHEIGHDHDHDHGHPNPPAHKIG